MAAPKMLDLFCCAGGAAMGYHRSGFDVYGVDIEPQANYPFPMHQGDALDVLRRLVAGEGVTFSTSSDLFSSGRSTTLRLTDFAAAHGSPPCQAYSTITPDRSRHPRLIEPLRDLLRATGLPYVIENVEGARRELHHPVKLCGSSFGLKVRRHRYFETPVTILHPPCQHATQGRPVGVYGDHPQDDSYYRRPDGTLRGNKAASVEHAREAMGIEWMSWLELAEAVPPAYTEHIGRQLLDALGGAA